MQRETLKTLKIQWIDEPRDRYEEVGFDVTKIATCLHCDVGLDPRIPVCREHAKLHEQNESGNYTNILLDSTQTRLPTRDEHWGDGPKLKTKNFPNSKFPKFKFFKLKLRLKPKL